MVIQYFSVAFSWENQLVSGQMGPLNLWTRRVQRDQDTWEKHPSVDLHRKLPLGCWR